MRAMRAHARNQQSARRANGGERRIARVTTASFETDCAFSVRPRLRNAAVSTNPQRRAAQPPRSGQSPSPHKDQKAAASGEAQARFHRRHGIQVAGSSPSQSKGTRRWYCRCRTLRSAAPTREAAVLAQPRRPPCLRRSPEEGGRRRPDQSRAAIRLAKPDDSAA